MRKDISIIIPTRNRINTLKECLENINKSTIDIKEIIIIDQSDKPLKLEYIKEFVKDSYDCIIINQKEPSSSKARNAGLRNATGDIILFMDDDSIINEKTLEQVRDTFYSDNKIKLVSALDVNMINIKKYSDILGIMFFRKKLSRCKGYVCKGAMLGRYPNSINGIVKTDWAMGYFFAVSREVILKYDIKFDEKLTSYAYAEDLDFTYNYCQKIKRDGFNAVINSEIYVDHLGSKEFRIDSNKSLSMYVIHRIYLSYKYFKSPLYRILLVWSDIGEILRRKILKEEYRPIIKAYKECFKYRKDFKNNIINKNLLKLMR